MSKRWRAVINVKIFQERTVELHICNAKCVFFLSIYEACDYRKGIELERFYCTICLNLLVTVAEADYKMNLICLLLAYALA